SALGFYRGGTLPTAYLQWDSVNGRFNLNMPLNVTGLIQGSGGLTISGAISGATTMGMSGALSGATTGSFSTSITSPLVLGGTTTTSDLSLQTTSGVGATGADMHFLVGNNGATEAMTILNSGNVGIGTTGPDRKLDALDASNPQIRLTTTDGTVYADLQNSAISLLALSGSTLSASSGAVYGLNFTPNFSSLSGTAGYTALFVNATDGAGSGTENLMDLQVGGSSKFSVDNTGRVNIAPGVRLAFNQGGSESYIQESGSNLYMRAYANYYLSTEQGSGQRFILTNMGIDAAENSVIRQGIVINESGVDSDTRIEGDTNANLFFVDASLDSIFIGDGGTTNYAKFGTTGALTLAGSAATIASSGANLGLAPASGYGVTGAVTLNTATGDEVAYSLATTINKATSGNYTGIKLNVTETSAPGIADKLIDLQVAGVSKFFVDNAGAVRIANSQWFSSVDNIGTGFINMFRVNTSDQIEVGAALSMAGGLEFAEDSGVVTAMDMPVSATPAAGTEMSYVFRLDATNIFKIYSESNGAGGIQNAATVFTVLRPLTADLASGDGLTITGATAGELTAASGAQNFLKIAPFINQSGTAGYTALLVNSTETLTGSGTKNLLDLQVGGVSKFSVDNAGNMTAAGSKAGYVVDVFINGSGQTLSRGQIVKLKGTAVTKFIGNSGKIPVPEITLADSDDDPMVLGVVDSRRTGDSGGTNKDESIPAGEMVSVVTLGAYNFVKVDAGSKAIAVGDYLKSSSNPGYATRADQPKQSYTFGRALGACPKNTTCEIPVLILR
ncbi:MAG: hypothetical protein CEN89_179, partial [Candidatus Berkelbacteria bacterium Licking1014_7]